MEAAWRTEGGARVLIGIDGRPANQARRSGAGRYCHELLNACYEAGFDAHFRVYLDADPRTDFPTAPDRADVRVLTRGLAWTQFTLARELRRNPPDVFLTPGLHVPVLCSCPRVVTVFDLAYYEFAEHFTWRFRMSARVLTRLAVRRADHFLAISEATKTDLVGRFGIDPARVTVTHLGCSPQFRRWTDPETVRRVREEYKLPDRFILYVGRLQPRKNLPRLIEAFGALRARRPELPHHLVIAGDEGWLYSSIYRAAEESPACAAIRFIGFVDGDDLPVVMSEADALALVSLWEGFGLPVVEAMGCGTAVVASTCSSLPEVAGDAALLVDPYDTEAISSALERVLLDDDLRRDLEERGVRHAAQFTWANTARRTLDALGKAACEHEKRD